MQSGSSGASEMPALSEYSNVYNDALLILLKKGYQVWYSKDADVYCAERNGWDFQADTPCGLLGIVAIYEFRQPAAYVEYWWREDGSDVYHQLPEQPRPYKSVVER
jgi:hypothetical protein